MTVHIPLGIPKSLVTNICDLVESFTKINDIQNIEIIAEMNEIPENVFVKTCRRLSKFEGWDHVGKWIEEIKYVHSQTKTTINTSVCKDNHVQFHVDKRHGHVVTKLCPEIGKLNVSIQSGSDFDNKDMCILPKFVEVSFKREYKLNEWTFILSKRWQGPTLKETFKQMDNHPPINSIQTKLMGNGTYINKHSCMYISVSLLLKIMNSISSNIQTIQFT